MPDWAIGSTALELRASGRDEKGEILGVRGIVGALRASVQRAASSSPAAATERLRNVNQAWIWL